MPGHCLGALLVSACSVLPSGSGASSRPTLDVRVGIGYAQGGLNARRGQGRAGDEGARRQALRGLLRAMTALGRHVGRCVVSAYYLFIVSVQQQGN